MKYGQWNIVPIGQTFYRATRERAGVEEKISGFLSVDAAKSYIDKHFALEKGEVRKDRPAPVINKRPKKVKKYILPTT